MKMSHPWLWIANMLSPRALPAAIFIAAFWDAPLGGSTLEFY